MAEVYQARRPTPGRDLTVEILHRQPADRAGFHERFEHETMALAALRHSRVVEIFNYETDVETTSDCRLRFGRTAFQVRAIHASSHRIVSGLREERFGGSFASR
jgi:hypothetical protein